MFSVSKQIVVAALLLFLLTATLNAAEVAGKWTGSGELKFANGESRNTGACPELQQSGQEVTGTAGPSPDRVLPISKGKIDGNKLTFEVMAPSDSGDRPMSFEFTISEDKMEGTVKSEQFTGKLSLKRS